MSDWHYCLILIFSLDFISLDPDADSLCMLLLIDFLAIRSREYHVVLQLYQDWEVKCAVTLVCMCVHVGVPLLSFRSVTEIVVAFQEHRNLSQLPNFAFSTALCNFHLSQQDNLDPEESCKLRQKADQLLQNALIMFPAG